MLNPILLRETLRKHLALHRLTQNVVGERIGVSGATVSNFLNDKYSSHRPTLEKIEDYLRGQGFLKTADLTATGDSAILASLGISNSKKHYICANLDDFDFALFVQAIMNAPVDETTKKRLLGTLCTQTFPALSP